VIVTHGELGAVLHRAGVADAVVPAPNIEAVDTTGAGDTFCGALVAALSRGEVLEEAVGFAVTAASLSVQRAGAVPSIPFRHEIDAAR
jgi:ribokinase